MMSQSIIRVRAIYVKDLKDSLRNYLLYLNLILPLFMAYLYTKMGFSDVETLGYPITIAIGLCGVFIQAISIAEEKEKNTLRALLLSPITTTEIFIGKALLTTTLTLLVVIGILIISVYQIPSFLIFGLATLICLACFIALGTLIGLLSRSVTEISMYGLPILLLVVLSPVIKQMIQWDWLIMLIAYLPHEQYSQLLTTVAVGESMTSIAYHLSILMLWTIASAILTVSMLRRSLSAQ